MIFVLQDSNKEFIRCRSYFVDKLIDRSITRIVDFVYFRVVCFDFTLVTLFGRWFGGCFYTKPKAVNREADDNNVKSRDKKDGIDEATVANQNIAFFMNQNITSYNARNVPFE